MPSRSYFCLRPIVNDAQVEIEVNAKKKMADVILHFFPEYPWEQERLRELKKAGLPIKFLRRRWGAVLHITLTAKGKKKPGANKLKKKK